MSKIVLTQTASWNPSLTNPYRVRYATAEGRYFMVRSDNLHAPWLVDEITEAGEYIKPVGDVGVAFRLSDARKMIEEAV